MRPFKLCLRQTVRCHRAVVEEARKTVHACTCLGAIVRHHRQPTPGYAACEEGVCHLGGQLTRAVGDLWLHCVACASMCVNVCVWVVEVVVHVHTAYASTHARTCVMVWGREMLMPQSAHGMGIPSTHTSMAFLLQASAGQLFPGWKDMSDLTATGGRCEQWVGQHLDGVWQVCIS